MGIFIKNNVYEKNDNKKKSQVIQHLHGISEVNHVHMITSIFLLWGLLKSYYIGGETKIKVENEEYVRVMEDEIGKNPI